MGYKFFTLLSVILIIAQLALVLLSWIVVSIIPSLALKSLLSGEGIRWFLGSFSDNIANPSLAWLVLCAMAYGVCVRSGLYKALFVLMGGGALAHRQRHALYWSFAVFVILALAMSLLVFIPHSMLLGVTGGFYPSPLCKSVVPLLAFFFLSTSFAYGISFGAYNGVGDIFKGLYYGVAVLSPLFPVYVLCIQLFCSVCFVFSFPFVL